MWRLSQSSRVATIRQRYRLILSCGRNAGGRSRRRCCARSESHQRIDRYHRPMPEKTLLAFADHGQLTGTLPRDGGDCEAVLEDFRKTGLDLEQLGAELQANGAKSFDESWRSLLSAIESKGSRPKRASWPISPAAGKRSDCPRLRHRHEVAASRILPTVGYMGLNLFDRPSGDCDAVPPGAQHSDDSGNA